MTIFINFRKQPNYHGRVCNGQRPANVQYQITFNSLTSAAVARSHGRLVSFEIHAKVVTPPSSSHPAATTTHCTTLNAHSREGFPARTNTLPLASHGAVYIHVKFARIDTLAHQHSVGSLTRCPTATPSVTQTHPQRETSQPTKQRQTIFQLETDNPRLVNVNPIGTVTNGRRALTSGFSARFSQRTIHESDDFRDVLQTHRRERQKIC